MRGPPYFGACGRRDAGELLVSCWAPVRNKLSFSGQLWPPASTWASPRSVALIQKPGGRSVVVQSRITRLIASTRAIIVHSIGTPTSAHSTRPLCKHCCHTHAHNPQTQHHCVSRRDRRRIIRTTPILRIHVLALHAPPSPSPFASKLCFNATQGFHCPCTFLSSHPTALTGQRSKARGSDCAN